MLKALFLAISTLAIAHLIALLGFAAWLQQGDRLDMARINEIRAIFSKTITAEKADLARQARLAADEQASVRAAAVNANPPVPSANKLSLIGELDDLNLVTVERLRKESEDLRNTIARERMQIEAAAQSLADEQADFLRVRKEIRESEGSAQFKKALERYEGLKPDSTQAVFQTLIDQGETDQVVSYLNAMQPRISSKIIGKFTPEVAADLLERIRRRGVEPAAKAAATPAATPVANAGG